mmetsp:Transcript_7267/g.13370  ORF Transcript_7267/g.13370 Transcript_7267/m.13370 type:complete len:227 (+) Transcript_7267:1419-2099(+)
MSDSTVVGSTALPARWRHTSEVRRAVSASISRFSVTLSFFRAYCVAILTSASLSAYSTYTPCSSCSRAISASSSQSSLSARSASVLKSTVFSLRSSAARSAASHFLGTLRPRATNRSLLVSRWASVMAMLAGHSVNRLALPHVISSSRWLRWYRSSSSSNSRRVIRSGTAVARSSATIEAPKFSLSSMTLTRRPLDGPTVPSRWYSSCRKNTYLWTLAERSSSNRR